ncbi:MAG: ABC transporter ATP-binding protein/permease [Symbiobacteriaceae bacterium]|nr:ABC transporter ATP-binding protein/permease [Symbiobacteriaceae bacterium]
MTIYKRKQLDVTVSFREAWRIYQKIIKLGKRMAPHALPIFLANAALEVAFPYVNIILPAMIINELAGDVNRSRITVLIAMTVALNLAVGTFRAVMARLIEVLNQELNTLMEAELTKKSLTMDLELAENPKIQEMYSDTLETKAYGPARLEFQMKFLADIVKSLVLLGISSVLVARVLGTPAHGNPDGWAAYLDSPQALLALSTVFVAAIVLNLHNMRKEAAIRFADVPITLMTVRNMRYYDRNLISRYQFGKDVRLYGFGELIEEEFTKAREANLNRSVRMVLSQMPYTLSNTASASLLSWIIYLFVAVKALSGSIQVGDALLYIGAIQQFNNGLNDLAKNLATVQQVAPYTLYYFRYLEHPDVMLRNDGPLPMQGDDKLRFTFENVSFRYPGRDVYTLQNLNLTIDDSSHLGIVGVNGSGKTTFIKLLCRLYDPSEGRILLNGVDIREIEYEQYLRLFSVVFQDFTIFAYPVGENIAVSADYDKVEMWSVLEQAGLKDRVQSLPDQLNQFIYKNVDAKGIELSGGELQKVAIARALYRQAAVVILDEPTASLDPASEAEIYVNFANLVGNKTSIYISHRMSSCRFCDEILVFDDGQIIQRGNHETLVADCAGKYHQLWTAQAQYYTIRAGEDTEDLA